MPRAVLWLCVAGTLHAASTGGFRLLPGASPTSDPAEVVSGARSIKGSNTVSELITAFLNTDASALRLQRNQAYRVTFRYKILSPAERGFTIGLFSGTVNAQGRPWPSIGVGGAAGTVGTATLTGTLEGFDDYSVTWWIGGKGAIAIDDIQVANIATGEIVAAEDAELGTLLLSTFFVSTSKPAFIWGEPVKVTAALYDETGKGIQPNSVAWTVNPSTAASVAADGTVTPRALATFTVRGTAAGSTGEVLMQALPKRIVVIPENAAMQVGSTQKMRADVMDVNDQPISNTVVSWRVTSEFFDSSSSATIDSSGMLKGVMQARVRVAARISYPSALPGFDVATQGDTLVDIKAPATYRFERIFVSRPSGAATSTLAPRASALIPTESGGFMFAASLDGLGSALLEWNNGTIKPLLASGRINPVNGYPLTDFVNYTRTSSGEILVQEADASGSSLISRGPPGEIIPAYATGAAVFGAESTGSFNMSRNSLADSGVMALLVSYRDAVTHISANGLFRGFGRGVSEPVLNNRDSRLANGAGGARFNTFGIANDGAVWLESQESEIWRSRPGEQPRKILSAGDPLENETIRQFRYTFFNLTPLFFVAGNGDAIQAVLTDRGSRFVLWHDGDAAPSAILPVGNPYGLYWYDATSGALIDADFPGRPRGLYLWNREGARPLLLLNDTSLDGSPVQEILSAANTSDGTVYVMARTVGNPLLIARLTPDRQVLLKAGDAVPVSVPPVIAALIPGTGGGVPPILAGGQAGSIAQLDLSGAVTPVIPVGAKLPDGKYFAGSRLDMVRTFADGRIVFGHDYFESDSSLYTWKQGAIDVTVRAPLRLSDGRMTGYARQLQINRRGDLAFHFTWGGGGVYLLRDGSSTAVFDQGNSITVDGTAIQNLQVQGLDGSGSILFSGTRQDGSGPYVALWDGTGTRLIVTPGQAMPDGRQIFSGGNGRGCDDGFLLNVEDTFARYRNGTLNYMADPAQPLASGRPAFGFSSNTFDANRQCDAVLTSNQAGVTDLEARVGSIYHDIQDLEQLTPDGDLLRVTQVLVQDDGTIYALGANDRGEQVLYRARPLR